MSGIDCQDPDHSRCEQCNGCVTCGCLCHLTGESPEEEGVAESLELVHIEFGLQPYRTEQACPKCAYNGLKVTYHSLLVMNVGAQQFPCGSWYRSGILTGDVSEHLCIRCLRCGYGWPTQTADTFNLSFPEEPEAPQDSEEPT